MIHYGDITQIKGDSVPIVDVVTGGSPCQDLSVAGKRAGLAGERSGLFMEQIRIIAEMIDEDGDEGWTNTTAQIYIEDAKSSRLAAAAVRRPEQRRS